MRKFLKSIDPRHSLRAQISLASAAIVLSLSALLSLYATNTTREQIELTQGDAFIKRAKNALDVIDRGMFERSREIQNAAVLDEIRNPKLALTTKREVLERLQASFNAYAWIGICDVNGVGLVGTGKYLEGKNLAKRPWCTEGRTNYYIGDVHDAMLLAKLLPNPSGETFYLVDVAAPVISREGVLQGVLCGHIYWSWAEEALDSKKTPGQDIFLLSKDNKILSGPGKAWSDYSELGPQTTDSVKGQAKFGHLLERYSDGKTYLVGYAKSEGYREYAGLGWTAVVREDISTAFAPAQRLQRKIFLVGSALGIFFAWISWVMAGRFVRPIRRLSNAADKIASGDLHTAIPTILGDNEVAHLTHCIDNMVSNLTGEIQHRREAEVALSLSAKVFEHNGEAIMITDANNRIMMINKSFSDITGYNKEDAIGQFPSFLASGKHDVDFYRQLWGTLNSENIWRGEIWNKRKGGDIYPEWLTITRVLDEQEQVTHHIAIFLDITERKKEEERTKFLANYDVLSGLPNRYLLNDRIEQSIALAQRHESKFAVLFIDLDHFKNINDSLGHDIGDELLQHVAERLKICLRRTDTLARLGGDEFIAILNDINTADEATYVAEKIIDALDSAFEIRSSHLHITPSIGISIYPDDGTTQMQLMRNSDLAMYKAKQSGRNSFAYFEEEMNIRAVERLRLESDLRYAIEANQLMLYYQPKVSVKDEQVVGLEALLRWQHPEYGFISPAVFIPVAEQSGLINRIGDWVLRQAAMQLRIWESQGYAVVPIAVNLSAIQFAQKDLVERITNIVRDIGISNNLIELELTESALMDSNGDSTKKLDDLYAAGFVLALDDFGTGYSSLSRLKLLPVQRLKIDQSFVRDIATDSNDESIVRATSVLAHALGMTVTAEGVESREQLAFITELGCEEYQGYLYSRPVPAADAVNFLCKV